MLQAPDSSKTSGVGSRSTTSILRSGAMLEVPRPRGFRAVDPTRRSAGLPFTAPSSPGCDAGVSVCGRDRYRGRGERRSSVEGVGAGWEQNTEADRRDQRCGECSRTNFGIARRDARPHSSTTPQPGWTPRTRVSVCRVRAPQNVPAGYEGAAERRCRDSIRGRDPARIRCRAASRDFFAISSSAVVLDPAGGSPMGLRWTVDEFTDTPAGT